MIPPGPKKSHSLMEKGVIDEEESDQIESQLSKSPERYGSISSKESRIEKIV
jgi:hypothetical protein